MEKKSAKNCALYHVVNKSVWADIGAASTSSTKTHRHFTTYKFHGFFKCLQRQYIGANWFAAPIYWRSIRRTKLFAAPRLFGQTMPIQSAGVSGSGNRFNVFQDGGQNKNKNERPPQWELKSKHLTFCRPPLVLITHSL
jgi:hypothetical protein